MPTLPMSDLPETRGLSEKELKREEFISALKALKVPMGLEIQCEVEEVDFFTEIAGGEGFGIVRVLNNTNTNCLGRVTLVSFPTADESEAEPQECLDTSVLRQKRSWSLLPYLFLPTVLGGAFVYVALAYL